MSDRDRWYLADCRNCTPHIPIPFGNKEDRNTWANEHTQETGHTVDLKEEPR